MANRNFKNFSRGTAADNVLHLIKHLKMLKIINMIDNNAGILHRFINFLIKSFPVAVLKVKLCQTKN